MQPVEMHCLPLLLNELPEQRLSAADARTQRCAPPKQQLSAAAERTLPFAQPKQKIIAAAERTKEFAMLKHKLVAADERTHPFGPPKQKIIAAAAERTHEFAVLKHKLVVAAERTLPFVRPRPKPNAVWEQQRLLYMGAKTFPRTSGSSVHHSSGSLGSNAGEGGGEEAAYSCKKCKSAAAVHRADTECQVYVLPTSFNRSTQLCARLGVKSVQCDFVADCCVRRRTSAMTQTETKGSVSCMVQEPIPVAPLDPRCIACGLERSHNTVLHPLPVREPDRHKWIDFIRQCPGRGDSLHWTPPEHVQSFVCSLHFESSSFTRIFPEKRLRPSAIPTLYPKRALITTMGAVTAPEDGTGTHVTDVQWSHHALHAI
ncbi:uncharacterized protein LOC144106209 isoform X2 [Amblyomma americanum]